MNSSSEINSLVEVIKSTLKVKDLTDKLGLHEPYFNNLTTFEYLKECIDSGWVSNSGSYVEKFEEHISRFTKANYSIALNSGTSSLRLCLHLIGVKPGDEVILPPLSFVATANSISHLGATPHFVDIEESTLGLSAEALSAHLDNIAVIKNSQVVNKFSGKRIAAIVAVHVFGHPCNIKKIKEVADFWNISVIEDSAEALGSFSFISSSPIHSGLIGQLGILSFNANKIITTGSGGAIITNNSQLALRAKHLSMTAKIPHPWNFDHDDIGWNDRLSNLNAAIGVAQFEELEHRLKIKRKLAELYIRSFEAIPGVEIVKEPINTKSNYWLVTLRFSDDDPNEANRKRLILLEKANSQGLCLRPSWSLLNKQIMYSKCQCSDLSVARDQSNRLVNLPSSPLLLARK